MCGPFGKKSEQSEIEIGDIAQLSFDGKKFGHTLVIVDVIEKDNLDRIFVATHTFDSYYRRISTYNYAKIRFVHIEGVRIW